MNAWTRRLRGILGTGLVWGVLGAVVGVVGGVVGWLLDEGSLASWVLTLGPGFGAFGLLMGSGFAAMLAALEGRKSLEELSAGRAALWGAVAGGTVPLIVLVAAGASLTPLVVVTTAVSLGGLGAGLAGGSVLMARRAGNAARLDRGRGSEPLGTPDAEPGRLSAPDGAPSGAQADHADIAQLDRVSLAPDPGSRHG